MKKLLKGILFAIAVIAIAVCASSFVCDPVFTDAAVLAAFVPCTSNLAASLASDCDNPRVAGYEAIGLIMNRDDVDWANVAILSTNPRIVTDIDVKTSKTPFVIYNNKNNPLPFNGTNTSYNSDTDRYDKTLQFYFEGIGGGSSKDVVEPLKGGSYVVILQRKDHAGDGSFQIFGFQSGMKATAQVQDEDTGYWLMTMNCSEASAEISFFDTDYETTKAAFDTLLAKVA